MKSKSETAPAAVATETKDAADTAPTDDPEAPRVGFRRPPRHASFKKGQSGNPGGRPRRRRDDDIVALLCAALDAPTTIVEDGKRRRATKRELIASQLVDRSAQADIRATKLLVDLVQKIAPPPPEPAPLDDADEKVIATLLARLGMAE
jgi:Family of unknown function (DUF5681)